MNYDDWKTTPPDDRGFCPSCYGPVEDFDDATPADSGEDYGEHSNERTAACTCGWTGWESDLLSRDDARREGREEAAIARAEARMDEARDYRDDVT